MFALMVLVFVAVALAASAFVVLPLVRHSGENEGRRPLLAFGAGLGVAALGLVFYFVLGTPQVALSSLRGASADDYPELIASLSRSMRERPGDIQGWTLLGRGYMAVGNPPEAMKAFRQAVNLSKEQRGGAPTALLSSYGEAVAQASNGVTKEAEDIFRAVLEQDPGDLMARYYVGLAQSTRGDRAGALQLWEGVLADAPPDAEWRGALVDQIALLRAQMIRGNEGGAGGPPNPAAMVAQLASRLDANPNDLDGWLRLIRAYSVLGEKEKAGAALTKARTVFANQAQAQDALTQAANENALN
jgi:cytochrome c-type biogenesis protein CcmH